VFGGNPCATGASSVIHCMQMRRDSSARHGLEGIPYREDRGRDKGSRDVKRGALPEVGSKAPAWRASVSPLSAPRHPDSGAQAAGETDADSRS